MNFDKIKGVIYGQAIGDALGIPHEYKSKEFMDRNVISPLGYKKVVRSNAIFESGDFSDDTEMAIALLDAYMLGIERGRKAEELPDPLIIAERFVEWTTRDGRGMGSHTRTVLNDCEFLSDPIKVSKRVWEMSNFQAAANGAVMRTAYVGIMRPHELAWTAKAATLCAEVTHYDPRCVTGCIGLSVAVASIIKGETDLEQILLPGSSLADATISERDLIMGLVPLEELKLDEGLSVVGGRNKQAPIGYTWKTAGAGFWALREFFKSPDFRTVLETVIRQGGDADTNGAVVGALLGGMVGFEGLPKDLVAGLHPTGVARLESLYQRRLRL